MRGIDTSSLDFTGQNAPVRHSRQGRAAGTGAFAAFSAVTFLLRDCSRKAKETDRPRQGRRMNGKFFTRKLRRKLGLALAVLGMVIWTAVASLHLPTEGQRDVSISHIEWRTVGVIVGGAVIAAGIIVFANAV
jgi:hypothetical protein